MAFVKRKAGPVDLRVMLSQPSADGQWEAEEMTLKVKILTQSRLRELIELSSNGELNDEQIATEAIAGWSDYVDEDGKPVAFTKSNLSELLDLPMIPTQITKQLVEFYTEGASKN